MRQLNNIFDLIVSKENLLLAHKEASKGKRHYREVKWVNSNLDKAIDDLQVILKKGTFKTSHYRVEVAMKGGKERTIHKLPYYPDRIVQHAIVRVCKDFWKSRMIRDTFQSIEGRGTSDCFRRVRRFIAKNRPKYAMKLDIVKFYPSVNTDLLVKLNVFRVRCKRTLALLESIILSLPFLPLGNHTSQYAGNLLLTDLDWKIKQRFKVKGYFRYCDDLVFLGDSKKEMRKMYASVAEELNALGLKVKKPRITSLNKSCLDFVGYKFVGTDVYVRDGIASSFKKACQSNRVKTIPSYFGWFKHSQKFNLFFKHIRGLKWKHNQTTNYRCLST